MNLGGGLMAAAPAPGSALRLQFERVVSLDSPAPAGAYGDSQPAALPDPLDAPLPPLLGGDAGFGYSQQDGLFWCAATRAPNGLQPKRAGADAPPRAQHARLHHAARCAAGVRVRDGGEGAWRDAPRRGRDSWCRAVELPGVRAALRLPPPRRAQENRGINSPLSPIRGKRPRRGACARRASVEPSGRAQRSRAPPRAPAHR